MAHKDNNRPKRVAELVRRELALLIPRELDDMRAHAITLTHCLMTRDLKSARVYFTLLAGSEQAPAVARVLNQAVGRLRRALAGRLELRLVPELRFYFDASVERGARVSSLIDRAIAEDGKDHEPS